MIATVTGALGAAFLIFVLRVFGVALATVRTLFMTRGMELWSAVLGFFEVLVYVVAIGVVVNDLDNIPNVLGYCLGFSVGTVLGIRIERRLALGYVTVHVISASKGREVADALRTAGFGATLMWGEGRAGTVAMIDSVVTRKDAVAAADVAHSADRNAFVAVEQTSAVDRGWLRIARHER
jgi:uncharacterized protein YebE (UPF0316 family)